MSTIMLMPNHDSSNHVAYVNSIQCYLSSLAVPRLIEMRKEKDSFSLTQKSRLEQARALVYLVSICHRLNWDFTLGPLAENLWKLTSGFCHDSILRIDAAEFKDAFDGYRRDDGGLNYKQRLDYLKAVAGYASMHNFFEELVSSDTILGETGAFARISQMPIYNEDPLRKKCNALLHEFVRRQILNVEDPEGLEPAIDYHIIRLYLRTGRVVISSPDLEDRLIKRGRVRIEAITQLRQVVAEAMRYTAWLSKVTVSVLNDVEWAFARKACRRDEVWCSISAGKCPFDRFCLSAFLPVKQMVTEPDSHHGHY